ncbi:MAG TPA: efflux RND transporter periplasmic adaptor subunit [Anditalea sp.]|nr:efflux RND transporter periplasmic adaptor subunit [Anditalea sp.]
MKENTKYTNLKLKISIYCVVLSVILMISSCAEEEEEEQPIRVTTSEVIREDVRFTQQYPASVVALEEIELRADVVGYVTGIHVQEGQKVKRGQLLYTIDQTRYEARRKQAASSLAIAEANLERVQRDVQRYEKLKEEDAIAVQVYDDALTNLRTAEQEVRSAQSNLENAVIDLQYASIHAPLDGTVGFSQVRQGSLVSPGETLLNTISKDDPIGVDFYPEERYLRKFVQLKESTSAQRDSVFLLRLPDGEMYPYAGKIEILDRAVDRNTGTIQIRLRFDNPENILRPGLSANLIVKDETPQDVLTIPQAAVIEQMGEFSVFIVEEDTARMVKVSTGRNIRDRTVILNGLEQGQKVIVKGIQRVNDGESVNAEKTELR